jgi:hypothetical protein
MTTNRTGHMHRGSETLIEGLVAEGRYEGAHRVIPAAEWIDRAMKTRDRVVVLKVLRGDTSEAEVRMFDGVAWSIRLAPGETPKH